MCAPEEVSGASIARGVLSLAGAALAVSAASALIAAATGVLALVLVAAAVLAVAGIAALALIYRRRGFWTVLRLAAPLPPAVPVRAISARQPRAIGPARVIPVRLADQEREHLSVR